MNLQSGKFQAFKRGKFIALPRSNADKWKIFSIVNFRRVELLKRTILIMTALGISHAAEKRIFSDYQRAENWIRAKFPALKIEIIGNGSIRQ